VLPSPRLWQGQGFVEALKRYIRKVRLGEDAETSTRDARAPQTMRISGSFWNDWIELANPNQLQVIAT
jgi:hypothetical protein